MTRRRRAFTLIELLAVVALVALVAGLVLPRVGIGGGRRTLGEAEQLAAAVEYARQRAAVTGTPHRLLLDLDLQAYRVEAWLPDPEARPADAGAPPGGAAGEEPLHPADRDWARARRIPMVAPRAQPRAWQPVPATLGDATRLPEGVAVVAVETARGVREEGRLFLAFGADGSGEATRLELADEDGTRVTLEVAPLADAVRLAWGGLRETRGG